MVHTCVKIMGAEIFRVCLMRIGWTQKNLEESIWWCHIYKCNDAIKIVQKNNSKNHFGHINVVILLNNVWASMRIRSKWWRMSVPSPPWNSWNGYDYCDRTYRSIVRPDDNQWITRWSSSDGLHAMNSSHSNSIYTLNDLTSP